jgi:hypothetical protein
MTHATRLMLTLTLFALSLTVAARSGIAQGPSPRAGQASRYEMAGGNTEPDPFRPYGVASSEGGGYVRRPPIARRPPPPRPNFYAQRHNYYPTQGSGLSLNRTLPQRPSHCAPSRFSYLTSR